MIGANVSAVGGLVNAFNQAEEWSLASCQFYVKPSRSWRGEMVRDEVIEAFKKRRKEGKVKSILGHSALIHNLAGMTDVQKKSVEGVRLELEIATALGIEQIVVHSGYGTLETLKKSLEEIFRGYRGKARLLLEVSAGQKGSRGADVEELVGVSGEFGQENLGICLDTCHLYAAGFNVADERTFKDILRVTGKFLGAVHLNDSKGILGGHLDRHEHIGKGEIGIKGFRNIMRQLAEFKIPKILETPERDLMTVENLKVVRSFSSAG